MAFTCPRCARVSYSPQDERQGYCGACCDWTGRDLVSGVRIETVSVGEFQIRLVTDPEVPAGEVRLVSGESRRPVLLPLDPNTLATFITSSHTDNQSPAEFPARRQPGADGCVWRDAATWHPGYREL